MPKLYATEKVQLRDKIIHEHFFLLSNDWYIAEYNLEEKIMFGFAILNNDFMNAEWGNIDYEELRNLNVHGFEVDRDLDWYPKKAGLVERIVKAGGIF